MTGETLNNRTVRFAERQVIEGMQPEQLLEAARTHRDRIKWQQDLVGVFNESGRTRRLITAFVEKTGRPREDITFFMWRAW